MVMIPNAQRMGDMPSSEPVPEGLYYLRVQKVELKATGPNSKSPGSPMAEVQFVIFGPDSEEQYHGRKIFENFMLTGDGMFRCREFLSAAGCDEDFLLEDTDQLVEMESAAVVQVTPQQKDPATGKIYAARNHVARFVRIEG